MKTKLATVMFVSIMCVSTVSHAKELSFETMSQAVGILISKVTDIENELAEIGNERSATDSKVKLLQEQIDRMQKQTDSIQIEKNLNTNYAVTPIQDNNITTNENNNIKKNYTETSYLVLANLRIYKEASLTSRKIGIYNAGALVKVLEVKNEMALTPRGWVSVNFLEKKGEKNDKK